MKKILLLITILFVISFSAAILKFGVSDGIKMNAIAALCAIENRTPTNKIPSGIPIYEINIDQKKWNKLTNDLPKSGQDKKKAELIYDDIKYLVKIKLRGKLKLHWGGPKKSIRVYFKDDSPMEGIKKLNFVNPKTYQLINNHITKWIGDKVKTHTVNNEMVFLRINNENYGVMEMVEQPGPNYEKSRGLSNQKVPLYKGDYLKDDQNNYHPVLLWENFDYWVNKTEWDKIRADKRLKSLIDVINNDSISIEQRWSELEEHVIIDDFIRYYATLKIVNTMHIDQMHNQVLVLNNKENCFYPILWDPTFMWAKDPNNYYNFYDPLSYYILLNPVWREKRDLYIQQYLKDFYYSGAFVNYFDKVRTDIRPAVRLDYNKCNPVGYDLDMVYRFPNYLFERSCNKVLNTCNEYYQTVEQDLNLTDINELSIKDSIIDISFKSNSPLILKVTLLKNNEETKINFGSLQGVKLDQKKNILTLKIYGSVEHVDGANGSKYKMFSSLVSINTSGSVNLGQNIKNVEVINALTNQMILSSAKK